MELISPLSGQSLQLIVTDEIRPLRGGVFLGDLGPAIIDRYHFMKADPLTPGQPAKFQFGVFHSDTTITIEGLDIYQDGIVVKSTTTDDADIVLNDFAGWMVKTFEFRLPVTSIPRSYQSAIIISLNETLSQFLKNFQNLDGLLTKAFGTQSRLSVIRLSIGPEPLTQYPYQLTWNIESRIGQPYVPNRYMSTAPLTTTAHIDLLTALEAVIG